ncbi:MAG: DUF5688 family protein [Eubacteriales bacterium]|nr:DUF5688 family protein [Eubacteriales bacterium]
MMDFKEFTDKLEQNLKVALEDGPMKASVVRHDVEKMQGQSYTAITVSPANSNVGMNINADALYEQMEYGATYQNVVSHALNQATTFLEDAPKFDVAAITDYSQMKDRLFVDVVGAERNAGILSKVPHVQVEDMAMVYRIQVGQRDGEVASALITNQMMDSMGVTTEQLHEDALANAAQLHPAKVQNLSEVLAEMSGMPVEMIESSAPPLIVVSNEDKIKGASALFYPDMMDQIAKQVGGDFFVLPSSIHEVLAMPDTGELNVDELKAMVTSINGDVVDPADVLTDQVYHYDSKDRIFERGDKFEARQAEKELKSERTSVLKDLKEKQKDLPPVAKTGFAKEKAGMEI